ncbi:hypothetical protein H6P81_013552 [Aristolochia fimbriata]|uniref:Uncharacterized protein n=1 Tax=Aristolochia fimbriata TaxID=158543 RepID=A0AAV7EFF1_ARIFI|nr:hypothetical protein H6P81_013552 [Aristolochia fimbriata]
MTPALKRPKVETIDDDEEEGGERELALVALIEHRTKEVEHLKKRVSYYQSQLEEAVKRLGHSESQLARLRSQDKKTVSNGNGNVNMEQNPGSSNVDEASHSHNQRTSSRPQLVIPAANPKISQPVALSENSLKASIGAARGAPTSRQLPSAKPELEVVEVRQRPKAKLEQKEHKDLVPLIRSSSTPHMINFQPGYHINSQHKRKLRSLVLNPVNDQLFVTSALDGMVNLWQMQARGSNASLLSTMDAVSPKQRRWPEDITWHPQGDSLFCVYTADGGDSQISVLNLNSRQKRVSFLEEKPHIRGIINSIIFVPWEECFATGGSDHAVIFWTDKDGQDNSWKPKTLHRNLHSSAVMGVAGMYQKQVLLSAGSDKRIIGFDLLSGRADYRHQIETKCMSVLPNPSDFNLFMVQTAAPEKQLRLFDFRLRQTEIHAFGWKQESSDSQSALINPAWSPDGLYISSGSADPMIHIFDIRFNASKPSQSVKAHQKRVFKAAWHQSMPLLISISSDLQIGLHKRVN